MMSLMTLPIKISLTGKVTLPTACNRLLMVPVKAISTEASASTLSRGAPIATSLLLQKNSSQISSDRALMPSPAGIQKMAVTRRTMLTLRCVLTRLPLV